MRRRLVEDSPRHQRRGEGPRNGARQEAGQGPGRRAGGKPEPHAHGSPGEPDQGAEHDPTSLQAHVSAPEPRFPPAGSLDLTTPAGSR